MIPRACPVPRDGLLHRYVGQQGCYVDCYEVMHPLEADLPAFITAFYTTGLFRMERFVLQIGLRQRINDQQVIDLAQGAERFAAWRVEARAPGQVLLCDLSGKTRSWLAVAPKTGGTTRLLFGSAVVPDASGRLGPLVRALTPVHRAYAQSLLRLAEWRLRKI